MADGYASDGSLDSTVSSLATTVSIHNSEPKDALSDNEQPDEGRDANIMRISVISSRVHVQTLSGEFRWQIPTLGFSEDNLRTMARLLTVSEQWLADRLFVEGVAMHRTR